MGRNLGPLNIKDSYEGLVQISGSQLTDGSGSLIPNLEVTASYALTALSASYAPVAATPTLEQVLAAGNVGGGLQTIILSGSNVETRTFSTDEISSAIADTDFVIKAGSVAADLVLTGNGNPTNYIRLNENDGIQMSGSVSSKDNITAPLFIGDLQGNADTATSASYATTATSASYAATATSASHSDISDFAFSATSASFATTSLLATSASYALTASYLEGGVPTPTLQQVTTAGNNTTDLIIAAGFSGSYLISAGQLDVGSIGGDTNIQAAGGDLTLNTLVFPSTDGTTGQVLTTDGLGTLSFSTISATPFPYTGSADITGSINLIGSLFSSDSSGTPNTGNLTRGAVAIGGYGHNASGINAGIVAGRNGTATGLYTFLGGGLSNQATNTSAAVLGGSTNIASSNNSAVVGGQNNQASSTTSVVAGGQQNQTLNYDAFIGGGYANKADGRGAVIGGDSNQVSSNNGVGGTIFGGSGNRVGVGANFMEYNAIITGANNRIFGNGSPNRMRYNLIAGGKNHIVGTDGVTTASGSMGAFVIGGQSNEVRPDLSATPYITGSGVIGGEFNRVVHNHSVVIGGSSISSQRDDEVSVPNLTISNYASLNYPDDTAAAAGGVPLGGVYHNGGILQIRIV